MQMYYVDKERVETCPIETPPPSQPSINRKFPVLYVYKFQCKLFLISYLISAVTMF